ncbi:uncharacterized mitochondrial protein AtMg00810-like [Nymphaea colorata]|uniref:uncharacterized mitochondrial protein AtMg00810-like n=1 Tax=Nymphaea colorata TaxID=210225 RepID=UPI00129D2E7D|nr:uncharacterized mitochondrial protein AtMg00810-like [Nymphaea colorata]
MYLRGKDHIDIIIGVYVDDLIVTGDDSEAITAFKQHMMAEFEMSNLGLLTNYLGIEVAQGEDGIQMTQTAYAKKVLMQFGMLDCNPTKLPMEPRSQLHKDPDGQSVDATEYRRVIGCLRARGEEVIVGFTDNDLAGDVDDRKSTGGMAFYVNESLVSWHSQK